MALQRVCFACLLYLVFLAPRLALQRQQLSRADDRTCAADVDGGERITCSAGLLGQGGGAPRVLGRQPQRLVVAGSSGIHLSVKTAAKYHEERLSLLLLTWLQTVEPQQV